MPADAPPRPFLNVTEFAARMNVSRRTVRNWLDANACLVTPIDGSKPPKWRRADVDAFCAMRDDA